MGWHGRTTTVGGGQRVRGGGVVVVFGKTKAACYKKNIFVRAFLSHATFSVVIAIVVVLGLELGLGLAVLVLVSVGARCPRVSFPCVVRSSCQLCAPPKCYSTQSFLGSWWGDSSAREHGI